MCYPIAHAPTFFVRNVVKRINNFSAIPLLINGKEIIMGTFTTDSVQWKTNVRIGKAAEDRAVRYFEKQNISYKDVSNDSVFQQMDIDFTTDIGTVEVKTNYHNARAGKPGYFVWMELEQTKDGDSWQGWFYKCRADWFLFFDKEGKRGLLIRNDTPFRDFVANALANESHSPDSFFRTDTITDNRTTGAIQVSNMRVYLDTLPDTVTVRHIVGRHKV